MTLDGVVGSPAPSSSPAADESNDVGNAKVPGCRQAPVDGFTVFPEQPCHKEEVSTMGPYYRNSSQFMVDFIYSGQLLAWIVVAVLAYLVYRIFRHYRRRGRHDGEKSTGL